MVAGIEGLRLFKEFGIEVAPMREFGFVQGLEVAFLGQQSDVVAAGNRDVKGFPGAFDLGEHVFIGVVSRDLDFAVVLLFELGYQLWIDVIRPVENIEGPGLFGTRSCGQQHRDQQNGDDESFHV